VFSHYSAHDLITPAQPSGENRPAGPRQRHHVGAPVAVIAHRVPIVARPVRLAGGLPADEVDGESTKEERCTHRTTRRVAELTVRSG
jgi:hypothetical protein